MILKSTIKCPQCGFEKEETMPTDSCWYFYECTSCKTRLSPKHGDCCVFCSFGSVRCPPKQAERPQNVSGWHTASEEISKTEEKSSAAVGAGLGGKSKWLRGLSIFPVIGAVLVPGISCPACWPVYAGLLSSLGVGFFNYTPYLVPLTLLCLAVAEFSLGFRARRRRGFGPLYLGSVAALLVLAGKFILTSKAALYGGLVLLVSASIWNAWPRRIAAGASCSDCVLAAAPHNESEHRQP